MIVSVVNGSSQFLVDLEPVTVVSAVSGNHQMAGSGNLAISYSNGFGSDWLIPVSSGGGTAFKTELL